MRNTTHGLRHASDQSSLDGSRVAPGAAVPAPATQRWHSLAEQPLPGSTPVLGFAQPQYLVIKKRGPLAAVLFFITMIQVYYLRLAARAIL